MAEKRIYFGELRQKPVNFLATAPEVNLRTAPIIDSKNISLVANKKWLLTGKIGNSTGTILRVPGKNYFWMEIEPSYELKLDAVRQLTFFYPDRLWVRSDVIFWQGSKELFERIINKAGKEAKKIIKPVVDTVTDTVVTSFSSLIPYLILFGVGYKVFIQPKTK